MAQCRRRRGSMEERRGGSTKEERWFNGSAPDYDALVPGLYLTTSQPTANSATPKVGFNWDGTAPGFLLVARMPPAARLRTIISNLL